MKKILVCLLLINISLLASDRLSMVDITSINSVQHDYQEAFHGLDYTALMDRKLQHQERFNGIKQSLVTLDEKVKLTEENFNKYSQLFQKEEELMLANQENLSLDTAHALLAYYKKQDEQGCLSFDEHLKIYYMHVYLRDIGQQINNAVSKRSPKDLAQNKCMITSEILSSYRSNIIYSNLQSLCLDLQGRMLISYQNNMQQFQDELQNLSSQKLLKIQEKSLIHAALARMDALIPELLITHNEKIAQNIKSVTLLQSLYRMKLAQKQPEIVAWKRYQAIKSDIVITIIDDIYNQVFTTLKDQENAKLVAEWHKQQLFDQQEQERKKAENICLQKETEIAKEALRLQEIAILKIQKAHARRVARLAEKEKELKIIADQQAADEAKIAKLNEEIALLDTLIQENSRKNALSLITLAEKNITNIKDVFRQAVKSEKPLTKAMSVIAFYVDLLGVSKFDANIFYDNALAYARILKAYGIPGDLKRRSLILQDILQEFFEFMIKNDQSCFSPCSDEQAANLAKIHNLFVDFLEDNFEV